MRRLKIAMFSLLFLFFSLKISAEETSKQTEFIIPVLVVEEIKEKIPEQTETKPERKTEEIITEKKPEKKPTQVKKDEKPNKNTKVYEKLAKKLKLGEEELYDILNIDKNKNKISLLPLEDSKEHLNFLKEIFVKSSKKYMSLYGSSKSEKGCEILFKNSNQNMYKASEKPLSMTFLISINSDLAGWITIGRFSSKNPEVAYIVKEKFSHKGLATNSLKMVIDLCKKLNKNKFYKIEKIKATSNVKNKASQKVLTKNGFETNNKIYKVHKKPGKIYNLKL